MPRLFFALLAAALWVLPASAQTSFINEINYHDAGLGSNGLVEVVVPTGRSVSGWRMQAYRGDTGARYRNRSFDSPLATNVGGKDVYGFIGGFRNGPDALALVDDSGTVLQFISYEGPVTASDNQANGLTSTVIPVSEDGTSADGTSLQLSGTGTDYSDFTWQPSAAETPGAANNSQTFIVGVSVTTSATPGYRLLSVPSTMSVDALAGMDLVSGAGGYTVGAHCLPGGTGGPTDRGVTNIFTSYTGDPSGTNGGYIAPGDGDSVTPGEGFFWYLFGDSTDPRFPTTCTKTGGTPSSTRSTLPLDLSSTGVAPTANATVTAAGVSMDGSYMLGNPFQTAFDINGLSSSTGTLQVGVLAWDPELGSGGDYVAITGDSGMSPNLNAAGADDLSIWQGFFAEVTGAASAPTFTFDFNAAQQGVWGDNFYARVPPESSPLISFQVSNGVQAGAAAVIRFDEGAETGWDRYDLSKLENFDPSSYARIAPVGLNVDGNRVEKSVESRSIELDGTVDIPLTFSSSVDSGAFTLAWPTAVLPEGWSAVLTDLVTDLTYDLAIPADSLYSPEMVFEHSASAPIERFVITLTSNLVANESAVASFELSPISPNPTAGVARMALTVEATEAVRVVVYDALGRVVATVLDDVVAAGSTHSIAVPTAGLAAGVYVVHVVGASFAETRRLTVTR